MVIAQEVAGSCRFVARSITGKPAAPESPGVRSILYANGLASDPGSTLPTLYLLDGRLRVQPASQPPPVSPPPHWFDLPAESHHAVAVQTGCPSSSHLFARQPQARLIPATSTPQSVHYSGQPVSPAAIASSLPARDTRQYETRPHRVLSRIIKARRKL